MSIARVKVWGDEILTASDLNGEFNNIINNALALISPLTGTLDVDGNTITLDSDGDCNMSAATDDVITFVVGSGSIKLDLSTTSSVNGFTLSTAATGNPPIIAAQGTDSNIGVAIRGKGTGTTRIQNAAGTEDLFIFNAGVASAVNGYTFASTATGTSPTITASGDDTDLDVSLVTKGAGVLRYNTDTLDDLINGDKWYQNDIINSNFSYWQRFGPTVTSASSANNDDTYFCDRWIVLSNGNDVVDLSRETTTVPDNSNSALLLDVETQNLKFGILQILEAKISEKYEGRRASLSFVARRTGTSIGAVRAAVIKWGSTADSVTSDVVSAWGGAGTNPTLAANWSYCNTPATLSPSLSTSYQTYTIENIDVGSTVNNIAVFIWTDDVTMSVGDFLYLGEVQLTRTALAPVYHDPHPSYDLMRCMRFYEKTFTLDVAAADDTGDFNGALTWSGTSACVPIATWKYSVPKRVSPTVTTYNPRNGTNGQWTDSAADLANASVPHGNEFSANISNTNTAATNTARYYIHAAADAEL